MAPKRKSKINSEAQNNVTKNVLFEEKRYFKDPKKISEHLMCIICQDVFDEPWVLACGHTYCKKCIDTCLESSSSCPVCRIPAKKNCGAKNFSISNIIGDLTIACPWRPYGCSIIDKYYVVKDHQQKCVCNPNMMDPIIRQKVLQNIPDTPFLKIDLNKSQDAVPMSGLDELMAAIENGPLDDSVVEDDLTALPELEEPSLAMRLYMKRDQSSNILLDMLDSDSKSKSKPPAAKKIRNS